ncbi:amino acid permease, partial [Bacillus subtilis]
CLSAAKLFSYNKSSNTYGPIYKTFASLGSIVSFILLLLLLVPGSHASLSAPSYIALGGWLVSGFIFFIVSYPKLKRMDNNKLSLLILNRSESEVVDLINENKAENTNK